MANLLYLVHRIPYPPNKGDKVRSYHLLRHLAARHRVFLGTFVDDPDDAQHVPTLREWCVDVHAATLSPRAAKVRSLAGLLRHEALTLGYYRDAGLAAWVRQTLAREKIDAVVVFSSAMAQYVKVDGALPTLVDFVDVDSEKWAQYASARRWPMSWLYRREGERLLAFERAVAAGARRSFFVADNEVALFRKLAPECAQQVETLSNGVDADFFSPDASRQNPFRADEVPLVFTGAMDYWPNIDGATWFATEMLPRLRQLQPRLRFYVVGRSPAPEVQALASDAVVVTGTVPDVRPYLEHAAAIVAPLRVARGIQNKVLEAMAMAKAVVASSSCVDAIGAVQGEELVAAERADDFVDRLHELLQPDSRAAAIGRAARQKVLASFSWSAHLAGIDRYLEPTGLARSPA